MSWPDKEDQGIRTVLGSGRYQPWVVMCSERSERPLLRPAEVARGAASVESLVLLVQRLGRSEEHGVALRSFIEAGRREHKSMIILHRTAFGSRTAVCADERLGDHQRQGARTHGWTRAY